MANQVDQYILKVTGEEELRRLEAQIEAAEAALRSTVGAHGAASAAAQHHGAALARLRQQYDSVAMSVKKADIAVSGMSRKNAMAQVGIQGAQAIQDIVQGGPGAAVNNALFLASQQGVRALGAEAIAAAGGIATLGAAFAGVAVAAGAAFLIIDNELEKAKLEWSDLDNVISNTTPWIALSESIKGVGVLVDEWELDTAIEGAWDATGGFLVDIGKVVIGWDSATEAARKHKEEVEETARMTKEAAEATARLKSFQSQAQEKAAGKGKAIGQAIAEMGGAGGGEAVLTRLAGGAGTDEQKKMAKDAMAVLMGKAMKGDERAIAQLRPLLAAKGFGMEAFDVAATEGIDLGAQNEEVRRNQLKGEREARRYSEKLDRESNLEDERRMKEGQANLDAFREEQAQKAEQRRATAAGNLQGGFAQDVLFGRKATKADIARRLQESQGFGTEEANAAAGDVLGKLQKGFSESIQKRAGTEGITFEEAMVREREDLGQKMADQALGAARSEIEAREQAQAMQAKMFQAPDRIATEDFARAVEAGGRDLQKDQLSELKKVVERLDTQNDLMKNTRQIARLAR